jgi:hypothetical protein
MKNYIHARLDREEQALLKELIKVTGETISALVKKGLRLVYQKEMKPAKSALELAGDAVGCVASGIRDLSTNKKHLEGFGRD